MSKTVSKAPLLSLCVLLLPLAAGVPARAQVPRAQIPPAQIPGEQFTFKVGASYDRGDYGSLDTVHTLFVPVTLRYIAARFDVSATPALALVHADESVRLIDGAFGPALQDGAPQTQFGIGDTIIRGRVYLLDDSAESPLPGITPFVRLKLPTAEDDLQISTGELDYGFGVELDKQIAQFLLFGDLAYTVVGQPDDLDLRNRIAAAAGAGYRITDAVMVSGLLDWRRSILEGNANPMEAVGIVSVSLPNNLTVSPHFFVGLSDSSPDFGVGVELALRFGL